MTTRCRLAVAIGVLGAAPAYAHGDMAAKGLAELFMLAIGGLFLVVSLVLGVVAWRMTAKGPTSTGAVFRAGLVGVLALVAFAVAGLGAAMGSEAVFNHTPAAFGALLGVVPALFAAQFWVSARLYRRVGARSLCVGSTVLAVGCLVLAALSGLIVFVDTVVPASERTSSEVRAYRTGCERNDGSDCNMLGLRLRTGDGTPRDAVGATKAFERACELKASIGCRNLSDMLNSGDGVPRDEAAARRWLERYTALDQSPK